MNLIYVAIVLGLLAAALDYFIGGIAEPWRKIIFFGIIILLVLGVLMLLLPGFPRW